MIAPSWQIVALVLNLPPSVEETNHFQKVPNGPQFLASFQPRIIHAQCVTGSRLCVRYDEQIHHGIVSRIHEDEKCNAVFFPGDTMQNPSVTSADLQTPA
jgi:hypothetical protein